MRYFKMILTALLLLGLMGCEMEMEFKDEPVKIPDKGSYTLIIKDKDGKQVGVHHYMDGELIYESRFDQKKGE